MISLPLVYTILALVAYTSSFWYLFIRLMSKRTPNLWCYGLLVGLGLLLHGVVLYQDMMTPMGINYDVFNLISFTSGLMLTLSLILSLIRPVLPLNLIGTPVAAFGLILGFVYSKPNQFIELHSLGLDLHIILSLSAYAVLLMATIHAVLLWFQDRELKKKQKKRIWVNLLPPFQVMESLLFDLIITGFGLLTAALLFGFFTIDNFFAQHLAHKTAFSIISWFLYGALLIGHYKFGWRGLKAIRFTITGFILLAIGFIGSKFVLEMILGR
ncbi:cytochrome C assembly family protein [Acinetobacter haemolyticus]|uniref:cytochrome C assembly family protein n=1 Tax=Acinetobacter haemolyticus TaxID=29430 RepID=UPI00137246A0|nr:cytochrome c biogenesis protein CcsA [Acinetobacter haemolyticus]NAR59598.1 cytochrome C assembly protein [Acinetobacter haemolyticus]NAR65574.1 cytochrome C assembly protein [Acinetobacter haemolyticus]NAR81605.1 cytochrome C assembly protein [Acinetobacter haemolyticus]NAR92091.1 cytochrome C assembly protein [Acinetobacter haemolyticus]NAS09924.1 cytochrome C assembly protein [Acinetobacter haemolyticus]